MSAWDAKSWADVLRMEAAMRSELEHLRALIGAEDPDADKITDSFRNIESFAGVAIMAASWCKDD